MQQTKTINLIFPHQLFEESPLLENGHPIYFIEEYLFFNQYAFHKQKLALHRASMKAYENFIELKNITVFYASAVSELSDIRTLIYNLAKSGVGEICYIDTTDDWLEKRIKKVAEQHNVKLHQYESPLFLNKKKELPPFFRKDKKKFFQTEFYISQRKKYNLLLEYGDKPQGGKWSFDAENRKKYPRKKNSPTISLPHSDKYWDEACQYVTKYFPNNPGNLPDKTLYPYTFAHSRKWLNEFLLSRFEEFGTYEDAIVAGENILHHSVLTPMLNIGLITPGEIIDRAVEYAKKNEIPLNSLEGFVRQIIGWREFIRGIYEYKGVEERTKNYWGFKRKIPASFYDGTTGILPIDITIKKVLKTAYCHHIERLMVLGNFMLLCEFEPDDVYKWFMELFIDAYDWVMVPNVYGMSQFADGGLMSTKPYISGSNYLKKMSNYPKGEWQQVWDGLFWRFMHVHRDFFTKNPRLGMLVRTFDKMDATKREKHLQTADLYLNKLDAMIERQDKMD